MRDTITLTQAEANALLGLLSELPIKYLPTVQAVQEQLAAKFAAPETPPEEGPAAAPASP